MNVPCGNLQSDHDQLVDDQSSERDRDNVQELVLEEEEGHDHDGCSLIQTDHQPHEECLERE